MKTPLRFIAPPRPLAALALALAVCALLHPLQGAETAPGGDPDLPQPFDPAAVAPVLQSSPFTRMVNMSDNLVLTGIAYIDGKPVATVFNKETKQSFVVSEEPNFQGWTLSEALPTPDITRSQAKITIGGEVVSVRYDASALTKESMKGDRKSDSGSRDERRSDDGRYSRSSRGPSEEDRKRYESLSDSAREKFRNMMQEKFRDEKFRNAPEEVRRSIIRNEFEKIEKEDKKGR
jgi:hypothetical protein